MRRVESNDFRRRHLGRKRLKNRRRYPRPDAAGGTQTALAVVMMRSMRMHGDAVMVMHVCDHFVMLMLRRMSRLPMLGCRGIGRFFCAQKHRSPGVSL